MASGVDSIFADEALVMFRPFRAYRAISAALASSTAPRWWIFLRRPLLFLFAAGMFVSFTAVGRLVWIHVASAMIAWAFVPLYEILWLLLVVRLFGVRGRSVPELVDLYFAGQGPWLLFFLVISGLCLFAPEVWPAFRALLSSGVLIGYLAFSVLWGALLTFAYFRDALGLRARVALGAMFTYYVVLDGVVVAYYFGTGQLGPLLFGVSR